MSSEHRRYLLLEHGLGSAAVNFVLNGAIAWLMFRGVTSVPLWGSQSIAGDTIGTSLFLPLITCVLVTRIARAHVGAGRVAPIGCSPMSQLVLRWLPAGTVRRGVSLGLTSIALPGALTVGALAALGVAEMPRGSFLVFKASFAAVLAALVTPVIALWVIAAPPVAEGALADPR
jgi:hypothetical protein